MKRSKQIKGMTLLEIMVVMAIIGILLTPIWGMMTTNMRLNREANERVNAKDVALLVQDYIYNQVKWANKVEYSNTWESTVENTTDEKIYIDGTKGLIHDKKGSQRAIYSKAALDYFDVALKFEKTGETLTDITVTVSKMYNGVSEVLYTNNTSIKSINIISGSIQGTTGSVIVFTVPVP